MKKNLNEILDNLNEEELDSLMDRNLPVATPDDVTLAHIQTDVLQRISAGSRRHRYTSVLAAVACIALLVGTGVSTLTYAAEQKKYREAITFFEEYALPTDGLSKKEIKAVFRDITTNSFTYAKTESVIKGSKLEALIPGYELTPTPPSTGDIPEPSVESSFSSVLPITNPYAPGPKTSGSFRYGFSEEFEISEDGTPVSSYQSYLEKHIAEQILWHISFDEFAIYGIHCPDDTGAPILVFGSAPYDSNGAGLPWIACVSQNGELLWKKAIDNGYHYEGIEAVISNPDDTCTVFSRCNSENTSDPGIYLCVSKYTSDGTQISHVKNPVTFTIDGETGTYRIAHVIPSGDGYILQLYSQIVAEFAMIARVDCNGIVTETYSYQDDSHNFYLRSIYEHNGTVYLSGYTAKKVSDKKFRNYAQDVMWVKDQIHARELFDYYSDADSLSGEKLTALFRENFTAVLLVCNPDTGTPEVFYSVEGALGGSLRSKEDNSVSWYTESILSAEYHINRSSSATYTDSFTAVTQLYDYTLSEDGTVIQQTDLGITGSFSR